MNEGYKKYIEDGKAVLGIELGSTRIKAVLIGEDYSPIASGNYEWENKLVNGYWTYSMEDAITGLQECYADLIDDVKSKYDAKITKLAYLGISGMMHGYLPLDKDGEVLEAFRTWRNTTTEVAAEQLTELFEFNIPERWSIAHLYQAILNKEEHVKNIDYLTTLAGYIHLVLTGEKAIGIGEASGMFPIDPTTKDYDVNMKDRFNELLAKNNYGYTFEDIFPKVLVAGENAGKLTEKGAKTLDKSGLLQAGIPLCPAEGDAQTGMVATNSVAQKTGNISAGTSVFAMIVLEEKLSEVYRELDIITTPSGDLSAMVHCNNCTSDINAWVNLFKEFSECFGMDINMNDLYGKLYNMALEADVDCGGLLSYNYYSGEFITRLNEGRPLFVRMPDSKFNIANLMRVHLFSSISTLAMGMDILKKENVNVDVLLGHGGLFKTPKVGQLIVASALDVNVRVMETAGEGGAWGIAVLAAYCVDKALDFPKYLKDKVFANQKGVTLEPDQKLKESFEKYLGSYAKSIEIEKVAISTFV